MIGIEGQYWIKLAVGVIFLFVGILLVLYVFSDAFRILKIKDKILCMFSILLVCCIGIVFTVDCAPNIVTMAKQEYIESDVMVVECISKTPVPYNPSKYEKLVIYIPETGKNYEVNIVGEENINIQEGKIYHIKYYPAHLEKDDVKSRWVEFLYCVDDMNEEAQSTE